MTIMKVAHFTCYGSNVGDNALTFGVKNIVNYVTQRNNQFINIPLRSVMFTKPYIEKLNKEYDLVIIGGGGILHTTPSVEKRKVCYSGTLLRLSKEYVKLIKIPLIFYGVGFNVFRNEMGLTDVARDTIKEYIVQSKLLLLANGCQAAKCHFRL